MNAYRFSKGAPFPTGLRSTDHDSATYALAEFYRAIPDSFIVKMITGHRGDKQKAYNYAKQLMKGTILRSVAVGKASLCLGGEQEDALLVKEGKASLAAGALLKPLSRSEQSEYRRLMAAHSDIRKVNGNDFDAIADVGCSDYGNDDEEAMKDVENRAH